MVGIFGLSFLFGAGCGPIEPGGLVLPLVEISEEKLLAPQRRTITPGIEVIEARMTTSTTGNLSLFGFVPSRYRFEFVATSTKLTMREWKRDFPNAIAGINGVYFLEDLRSAGFFMGKGPTQIRRRFDLDKSVFLATESDLQILDTSEVTLDLASMPMGVQTYPLLIKGGKPELTRDTGKEARRSWVGTDKQGRIWLGVLPDTEVSLFVLMQRLMEVGVDWDMVANLDGGPSTGLFINGQEGAIIEEGFGGVPNILLLEEKA